MGYFRATGVMTAAAALLAGCANLPSPHYVGFKGDDAKVTVDDLVGHIQCELYTAKGFSDLAAKKYRVTVTLTLKVEDNAGLTPSLSFIQPLKPSPTSYTTGLGGALSVNRQRQFVDQYTIALDALADPARRKSVDCGAPDKTTLSLQGDLGIGGVIAAGLDTAKYQAVNVKAPSGGGGGGGGGGTPSYNIILDPSKPAGVAPNGVLSPIKAPKPPAAGPVSPAFGTTIQFSLVRSANAGPNWVLSRFKGPAGANGLASYGRTNTDTLVMAFAPAESQDLTAGGAQLTEMVRAQQQSLDDSAEARAQAQMQLLTTTMILQNLGSLSAPSP